MFIKFIPKLSLILFTIFFSLAIKAKDDVYGAGLLWEIENIAGQKSVLFGTMHFVDDDVKNVLERVKKYIQNAHSVSVEYVPVNEDIPLMEKMIFKTNLNIKDRLTNNEYKKLLKLLIAKNIPFDKIEYASPSYINALLIDPKLLTELHMDAEIMAYATKHNIKLKGLENIEDSFTIVTNLDNTYFINEIKRVINNPKLISRYMKNAKALYLNEDLEGMRKLIKQNAYNPKFAQVFFEQAITRRNKIMLEPLITSIEEGGAFVAVGAGHLGGEEGLLCLLSRRGYKISRIKFMN